jgi:hypothetical protein
MLQKVSATSSRVHDIADKGVDKNKGKKYFRDLGEDERIKLIWILEKHRISTVIFVSYN